MCRNMPSAAFFLAAGVLLVPTTPAHAEQPARIKEMSFTTQSIFNQVISVTSTDNKKWDSIAPGSIKFGAHMMIDTRHYALPIFVKGVGQKCWHRTGFLRRFRLPWKTSPLVCKTAVEGL